MSLPEVLIASLLLASSSGAAIGVWSQAVATWQHGSELQKQADQLELIRLASHRWLTRHGSKHNLLLLGSDLCQLDVEAVAVVSDQNLPLPQGITRQWVVDPERLGVWQELSALNSNGHVLLQRSQLVSPAAYGLCKS
ncbi:MAG: hypothetical protein CMP86_10575 [Gammaproteobacteria bacterium]|nr:hypothetical protein [Gammaproteobacteria bacterium]